mmetsp:Transcript_92206/g.166527  ORF Transcript_92206/g.166527 Transcript_92206/m.166527 type:complete len:93 (-) Transcript_92206:50-328(-)
MSCVPGTEIQIFGLTEKEASSKGKFGKSTAPVNPSAKVASWSSQLPDAAWFDAYASDGETQQTCKEISYRRYPKAGQHFAGWDLLRVLFPAK